MENLSFYDLSKNEQRLTRASEKHCAKTFLEEGTPLDLYADIFPIIVTESYRLFPKIDHESRKSLCAKVSLFFEQTALAHMPPEGTA